jgi:hypothetical protein
MKIKDVKSFASISNIEDVIALANSGEMLNFSNDTVNKRHGALRDASRLQALATLAKLSPDKYLHFKSANDLEELLDNLCNYAPGLVALRLNKGIKIGAEEISRRQALAKAAKKMMDTDSGLYSEVIKGRSIDLCCVSGAAMQYLAPLFSERKQDSVKDSSQMKHTMSTIFRKINNFEFNNLDGDLIEAFGVFSCELFKNTQEHACTDKDNIPYIEHVEGMIASWDSLAKSIHHNDFVGHQRLEDYWKREAKNHSGNTVENLKCMQVSFFDTGPGLVGRAYPNVQFNNAEDEKKALINCIRKNFTSKKQSGAGNGYPTILSHLSRVGGMIRIRSGNQSIFNCFDKERHNHWEAISDVNLKEQAKEEYLMNFDCWSINELSPTCGTVVSILIPLRNDSGQHTLF